MMPRPPRSSGTKVAGDESKAPGTRQIWVLQQGQPVAMQVQTGISDGRMTEVSGDQLEPGMAVITDQRSAGDAP
jgi:HlyD family secretion protein